MGDVTRRAAQPSRRRASKDPDSAPRAPAEEADKRDNLGVTSSAQVRAISKAVARAHEAPPVSENEQGYRAGRASEQARPHAGQEVIRKGRTARRTTSTAIPSRRRQKDQ